MSDSKFKIKSTGHVKTSSFIILELLFFVCFSSRDQELCKRTNEQICFIKEDNRISTILFFTSSPRAESRVWKSMWPSWATPVPNSPYDLCGRKATLNLDILFWYLLPAGEWASLRGESAFWGRLLFEIVMLFWFLSLVRGDHRNLLRVWDDITLLLQLRNAIFLYRVLLSYIRIHLDAM